MFALLVTAVQGEYPCTSGPFLKSTLMCGALHHSFTQLCIGKYAGSYIPCHSQAVHTALCGCQSYDTPRSVRRPQCKLSNGTGIGWHECEHPCQPIPVRDKKNKTIAVKSQKPNHGTPAAPKDILVILLGDGRPTILLAWFYRHFHLINRGKISLRSRCHLSDTGSPRFATISNRGQTRGDSTCNPECQDLNVV